MVTVKSGRVFKPTLVRFTVALFYFVLLLIPGVLAAAQDPPLSKMLLVIVSLAAIIGFYTAFQIRIEVHHDMLVVRNLVKRYEIAWDQIHDVVVRKPWRVWQGWGVGVPALAVVTEEDTFICDASINLPDRLREELLAAIETEARAHDIHISASSSNYTRS